MPQPTSRTALRPGRSFLVGLLLTSWSGAALPVLGEQSVFVDVRTARGTAPATAPLLRISSQGQPLALLDAGSVPAEQQSLLIYLDEPLTTVTDLRSSLEWLGQSSEQLARFGEVRLVRARAAAVDLLDGGSATVEEIRQALADAASTPAEASVLDLRSRLETEIGEGPESGPSATDKRRRIVAHFYEELALWEWQQTLLEQELLVTSVPEDSNVALDHSDAPPARNLLLVRSDALQGPAAYSLGLFERHEIPVDELTRQRLQTPLEQRVQLLARSTAALGWSSALLSPTTPPADSLIEPAVREFSAAGGREVVRDRNRLSHFLGAIDARFHYRLAPAAPASAEQPEVQAETPYRDPGLQPLDLTATDGQLTVQGPRWLAQVPPRLQTLARARQLVDGTSDGPIDVVGGVLDPFAGAATVEAAVALDDLRRQGGALSSDRLRLSLVTLRLDREPEIRQLRGTGQALTDAVWLSRTSIDYPEDLDAIVIVAEDLDSELWGAARAEDRDDSLAVEFGARSRPELLGTTAPPPATVAAAKEPTTRAGDESRWPTSNRPRRPPASTGLPSTNARSGPKLLEILPPRGSRLTGRQTYKILLTNSSVARVVFELDGEEVEDDQRRPFSATVDLGRQVRPHTLRATAFSGSGARLGADVLQINPVRSKPGIRLTNVESVGTAGAVAVAAELQLEPGQNLDRVEFFRNERRITTLTQPPFRADLPGPSRPDADFVRAVAWFTDGSFFEDVQLLGQSAISEEVDVNLVEVYTVASDSAGRPISGLAAEDFELRLDGREIPIERFARAEDVQLALGVVIDSSESMATLMDSTKRAAARFLSDTLKPIDRAFVVDFDDRPRLAHGTTSDVFALIRSLASLQPSGMTALYDSILFAHLQFEPGLGRKAIVLLTDGDDFNSKFSYRKTYRTAASAGLPIYFLSLAGFDNERPSFRKQDLEAIAGASGGRVFYVSSMNEVVDAYGQIADELRNQYILAFSTTEPLSDEQLRKIKVRSRGPSKGELRWVVGRE